MNIYRARRDFGFDEFRIEREHPRNPDNIGFDQVWELNGNVMEAEVYIQDDNIENAAIKALNLFKQEEKIDE